MVLSQPVVGVSTPTGVCFPGKIDITTPSVTSGNDPTLIYSYWLDGSATMPLSNPNSISNAGIYYIKGTDTTGCTTVTPLTVAINPLPSIVINDPGSCSPLNLTLPGVTSGSSSPLQYSYWIDSSATISVPTPNALTSSGNFYIKGVDPNGCITIKPVTATVHPLPVLTVTDPTPIYFPARSNLSVTFPHDTGSTYTYWEDTLATKPLAHPEAVEFKGVYYIKATTRYGCTAIEPVNINILPPIYPVVNPPNAFTPNGDGINDTWEIALLRFYPDCTVDVFDRNGQVVYHSTGYNTYWDGKYHGNPLPIGTYYYIIKLDALHPNVGGSITIIR